MQQKKMKIVITTTTSNSNNNAAISPGGRKAFRNKNVHVKRRLEPGQATHGNDAFGNVCSTPGGATARRGGVCTQFAHGRSRTTIKTFASLLCRDGVRRVKGGDLTDSPYIVFLATVTVANTAKCTPGDFQVVHNPNRERRAPFFLSITIPHLRRFIQFTQKLILD